jgi:hypothetical protein
MKNNIFITVRGELSGCVAVYYIIDKIALYSLKIQRDDTQLIMDDYNGPDVVEDCREFSVE